MLYKDLLETSKDRFDEFFKEVITFENQFKYDDFNLSCYELMYAKNTYKNIASVSELKTKIPELKAMCKKCSDYFIPARNRSIPKYDVILGMQMEEEFRRFLSYTLGTAVERGDVQNKSYPDCLVRKKDGAIAAYFELKYHAAPFVFAKNYIRRECYEGSATLDYKKIEKQLKIIEDEIFVPVYYVHWIDYPCLKGIFYESSDKVKEHMLSQHAEFERKKREGDEQKSPGARYFSKIYSYLLECGSFEEMIDEFKTLL